MVSQRARKSKQRKDKALVRLKGHAENNLECFRSSNSRGSQVVAPLMRNTKDNRNRNPDPESAEELSTIVTCH